MLLQRLAVLLQDEWNNIDEYKLRRLRQKGTDMARPRKTETEPMTHSFVVRLTDTQYEIIKSYADQVGMSMAEFIRHQAIHGKIEIRYPVVASIDDLQPLTRELTSC